VALVRGLLGLADVERVLDGAAAAVVDDEALALLGGVVGPHVAVQVAHGVALGPVAQEVLRGGLALGQGVQAEEDGEVGVLAQAGRQALGVLGGDHEARLDVAPVEEDPLEHLVVVQVLGDDVVQDDEEAGVDVRLLLVGGAVVPLDQLPLGDEDGLEDARVVGVEDEAPRDVLLPEAVDLGGGEDVDAREAVLHVVEEVAHGKGLALAPLPDEGDGEVVAELLQVEHERLGWLLALLHVEQRALSLLGVHRVKRRVEGLLDRVVVAADARVLFEPGRHLPGVGLFSRRRGQTWVAHAPQRGRFGGLLHLGHHLHRLALVENGAVS